MNKWTDAEINILKLSLDAGKSHSEIAKETGRTTGAVRSKVSLLGMSRDRFWCESDIQKLRNLYEKSGPDGYLNLADFAKMIGRDKANVSRKAKHLGFLTSPNRKKVEACKDRRKFGGDIEALRRHQSSSAAQRIRENGHPRGALGMKHTPEAREKMAASSRALAAAMTTERQAIINMKIMKTRVANGTDVLNKPRGSWKAAWHEIGGSRKYYRSNWEANYAYYLQWLKEGGHIQEWKHEPKTFWFEGVKRGTVSYLPDFWVLENDGRESFHEVKGWMDDRSKTKIARMAKYHPQVRLIVIDGKAYQEIKKKVSSLVPGWTDTARDRRGL